MRRTVLAASVFVLGLALPGTARGAPEAEVKSVRFSLPAQDALVTVDLSKWPAFEREGDGIGVTTSSPRSLLLRKGKSARFVALRDDAPHRGRATYTLAPTLVEYWADPKSPGFDEVEVVDDQATARERFTWDDDRVFGALASADAARYDAAFPTWYLAAVAPKKAFDLPLALPAPGPDPEAAASIRVTFASAVERPALAAHLDGKPLEVGPSLDSAEPGVGVRSFTCRGKDLQGSPVLRIVSTGDVPPPANAQDVSADRGVVWIDAVTVEATMKPHAGPRVAGKDGVRVRLAEVDATPLAVPHRVPPTPVVAAKDAAMVIVATKDLLSGAKRLAEHRTRNGVRTVVIPAQDVWDGVGRGDPDPAVLATFVERAAGPAGGGTLRYVLLCGDATYDRGDLVPYETIPTAMARTKYNGATASDRRLTLPAGKSSGGPAIGRIPFRDPKDLDAYVDRVIAWEAKPRADATRRMLRFVTSEGRFGEGADALIEKVFSDLVEGSVPHDFDVEMTYASVRSAYCWPPPEFNDKVLSSLNEGSLLFTYVGHGWADGFDALRVGNERYPILESRDTPRVDVAGTPPGMFVIACTTARFDEPNDDAVGELLLKRPRGPLAYFGATRICHPVHNSLLGRNLALGLFLGGTERLGTIVQRAGDEVVEPTQSDSMRAFIELAEKRFLAPDEDFARLYVEGQAMYTLLGDPALRLPLPRRDLVLDAVPTDTGLTVTVAGADGAAVPDGTEVRWVVETPRNAPMRGIEKVEKTPEDPQGHASMKRRWAKANDKSVARGTAKATGGKATFTAELPEAWRGKKVHAKAWAVFGDDVHQGAATTMEKK